MKRILVILVFLSSVISLKAQDNQVVPYTLADRDRILRIEAHLNDLQAQTEIRFNSLDQKFAEINNKFAEINNKFVETNNKIDRLKDEFDRYFMWGFGMVIMGILGLTGFILYDRRTTVAPVQNKTERIIKVLKETSEKNEDLREALKRMSLW
jgi:predicted  nucleic acid-binding Zn-ribbon protein